jgi:hypothetical protein
LVEAKKNILLGTQLWLTQGAVARSTVGDVTAEVGVALLLFVAAPSVNGGRGISTLPNSSFAITESSMTPSKHTFPPYAEPQRVGDRGKVTNAEGNNSVPSMVTPLHCIERHMDCARDYWDFGRTTVAGQSSMRRGCYGWGFVRYHPSAYEQQWAQEAIKVERARGMLCSLVQRKFSDFHRRHLEGLKLHAMPHKIAEYTIEELHSRCEKQLNDPHHIPSPQLDDEVFSKFEYRYRCWNPPCREPKPRDSPELEDVHFSYIEPLVGLLRHPSLPCKEPPAPEGIPFLADKQWMLIDRWAVHNVKGRTGKLKKNSFLFDMGASTFNEGFGGPSQRWFYNLGNELCAPTSDFYMWELEKDRPEEGLLATSAVRSSKLPLVQSPIIRRYRQLGQPVEPLAHQGTGG